MSAHKFTAQCQICLGHVAVDLMLAPHLKSGKVHSLNVQASHWVKGFDTNFFDGFLYQSTLQKNVDRETINENQNSIVRISIHMQNT